ncbi:formyltetrahydrofolate deformylase [Ornithinimicrobium sp. INDO-MA30-4]|uniref:formyltetrahydrofolate deformylase n=1 Tax=Ornithinimicrobium sp. INDO-MA30-4 TaxID=2908651 RepID=UPI001F3DDE0A|nr:formyltetrahydrofolate deformylase [Ornithinimicrobium sp. INDO-MA30-4]UJH69777.1 formyltetrahydrofolate deformylase [Ornithinimicrobium sp. INDO-MA30-4]
MTASVTDHVPSNRPTGREFVLTVSCPDQVGIVHAVSGAMLAQDLTIVDSQQFGDDVAGEFHLRMHLRRAGESALSMADLQAAFEPVATEYSMHWDVRDLAVPHRVVIMVSKMGHCLNDLLFRVRTGQLGIEIAAIVSNHEDFRSLAQWHGVDFHHIPVTKDTKPEAEAKLRKVVERSGAETIILARYMQVLSEQMCSDYSGRIINIHHSLLPSFKGAKPYTQAHDRGVKVIGATAHYVTADLDEGPIIEQDFRRVDHRMSPADLSRVGQEQEAAALSRAVRWHAEQRIILRGHRTIVFD